MLENTFNKLKEEIVTEINMFKHIDLRDMMSLAQLKKEQLAM